MEVTAATQSASGAQNSQKKLSEDFDNFLVLLTTQLQYQDPLDPLDSNEFTQQLVSFTGVEQAITTNKNLENLIAQTNTQNLSNAVSYLGKEITLETDRVGLDKGKAKWEFSLETTSKETKLVIKDDDGKVVHSEFGDTEAGLHEFTWEAPEGTDPGIYQLEVTAKTASDTEVQSTIFSKGIVTSVESYGGDVLLASNGILTHPGNILAVKDIKPDA